MLNTIIKCNLVWSPSENQIRYISHSFETSLQYTFRLQCVNEIENVSAKKNGESNAHNPGRCDKENMLLDINKVCWKSIETETVFTKIEMNNEWNSFFKTLRLAFNTLVPANFPMIETHLKDNEKEEIKINLVVEQFFQIRNRRRLFNLQEQSFCFFLFSSKNLILSTTTIKEIFFWNLVFWKKKFQYISCYVYRTPYLYFTKQNDEK